MRKIFILTLVIAGICANAQKLIVQAGTNVVGTGNICLTLHDLDLSSAGTTDFSGGNLYLKGTVNNSYSSIGSFAVQNLYVDKTTGVSYLGSSLNIGSQIIFINGLLDLNGNNIILSPTAFLFGETESSRIIGLNGGEISITVNMNNPNTGNPGNLGAVITSSSNLGSVTIKRGHKLQTGTGLGSSINRYFDISPANDNNLNATLRLNYFDAELNQQIENNMIMFKSTDIGISWTNQSVTSRDAIANYVEKTGISSLSRWTLAQPLTAPLPVTFLSVQASCNGNGIVVTWKTAQELNVGKYELQKSNGAGGWQVISTLPPGINSNGSTYSSVENNVAGDGTYRIAEVDINGTIHYSSIVHTSCNGISTEKIWPNPVKDRVYLQINADQNSNLNVNMVDAKGSVIGIHQEILTKGTNHYSYDLSELASGVYLMVCRWGNGSHIKTFSVVKQ